ncbi:Cys-tRNA(Pro) deacylase [cf. Phormidesmis sp. LEGE 11477]|uniref:Cys-tRNA(Pro) deacylase n=1 Tax=cf. Phormidesmis sp. LEGE 11477 TaxID=1828680 RepID=UPI001880B0EA|nr:Cys-tRNA(Pro) deacylase [cf. Phormidesmis sp. LEGE 11477]MBE9062829.1 Cys-tRNA(Pro) deacylase [cf. Phormidesmis sp. LEGE 11477]
MPKTNAIRVLDTLGIEYELLTYSVDLDNLAAIATAQKLGLPADQVFKTLVVSGDRRGTALAVIPGSYQLDLKALARVSGDRSVETVSLKQLQPLTGYVRGGVTALACKKPYPVFLDEWAQVYERIAVSAGRRGLMIQMKTADYIKATSATVGRISQEPLSL